MLTARSVHRSMTILLVVFTCYLGTTGSLIQLVDLRALLTHQPATSPDMEQIRESINGTEDFALIRSTDYAAAPLPANLDYDAALTTVVNAARKLLGPATIRYVELRQIGGKPVGVVGSTAVIYHIDPASGALESTGSTVQPRPPEAKSLHHTLKWLHRYFSDGYLWINCVIGIALLVQVLLGLVMYFRMLAARARSGRPNPFWSAANGWRSLHRSVSIIAAAILILVAVTGTWLSFDSFMLGRYMVRQRALAGPQAGFGTPDQSAPLSDAALSQMLHVTLAAKHATSPSEPIKVIRLRSYAHMPQGMIVAGTDESTRQLGYNASTGKRVSATESGYPQTPFPFGWQIHETLKQVHRGDYFGLPGRFLDLAAGLSMVFLSLSGIVMYAQLFMRRRAAGNGGLFWQ